MTNYRLADIISEELEIELSEYSRLQKQLLVNRGLDNKEAANIFLNPSYDEGLHDPLRLNNIDLAVERILKAIKDEEKVTIFSDYDCDGIPGAVVLHDFFKAIGYDNFSNYIPHRHYEGFGLSSEAVEKIAAEEAKLIITIDCGTTSNYAVDKANGLGLDVIITDHHEAGEELPKAVAIVNPKLGDYPFDGLSGTGVVFKLVQALITKGDFDLKPGWEKWWLDMVGVATIADMVPLVDENRVLATYGLQVLRKSRRPGLQQLLRKQRANQRYLTEDDIGFTIAPRVNAASRMDTPEDAFHMLSATDEGEAGARVDHLERLNTERKTVVAGMTKEIHKRMKEMVEMPDVIVMGNPDWRPSLVGLSANKLAEEFSRPAFLWGRDGNGKIKGSCRSDGRVSVVNLMNEVSEYMTEHGGHHHSGGFSVAEEHIYEFANLLNEAYVALGESALIKEELVVDTALRLEEITAELIREQQALAPFGVGNPKPLYIFENVTPAKVDLFGKGKVSASPPLSSPAFTMET
jgi:single-stranded-DNA-specific exonuclease